MPTPSTGPITETPEARTVGAIFDNAGLIKWWNYPGERFGESYNGFPEYGTDFGIPYQSKVGSITSGVVVYVGNQASQGCQSIGFVVQISSSDGLYHYQHLSSVTIAKGAKVNAGDVIGYSGGLPVDNCSSGPHIEVRWAPSGAPNANYPWFGGNNNIWVNPLTHYIGLSGQRTSAPPESTTPSDLAGAIKDSVNLSPNSNVAALLNAINILQETRITSTVNPNDNYLQIFSELIVSTYITIGDNIIAFIINLSLILIGIYIFFKLTKNIVDLSTLFNNIGSVSASNRALQLARAAL